ncbi:MAG: nickel pincer cofactor biosynthesis protein LarB [Candidatus Hydrogenedentota bacterium]|jgi:NCAIR mutase (PurE)-related protein|uniref:Circadian phase modifier n=1 Tax=Sumerlaea chitinivorans TaxID=2250252 RepID=A0A2Z4Y554_SUMC1|nr:Circadian phase modifier [Candidatus Sumerlaea chitinivorans]RMH26037.1 MAG: nickel pincer cofactor biosynthesis protein LarB [Candidatus Hydrogenedentota bacterium]GIX45657.1 MAG: 1-(5-phosphoribosyl)-5-amino-4-imidazole-carboxylate carboxylase [Candidatus Sumerlaea sp.]
MKQTSKTPSIRAILDRVAKGELKVPQAEKLLREISVEGYAELLHTKVDLHRRHRRGVAEAVYCANKTADQIVAIVRKIEESGQNVLCTRVPETTAKAVLEQCPDLKYSPVARMLYKQVERRTARPQGLIAVLTAGTSDIPVAEEAALSAELMGNRVVRLHDVGVAGLHRLLQSGTDLLLRARVIIVVAGMEGALPSVVAGLTAAPVIAVPTSVGYGAAFGGVAALLGMLNSCSGGVAVVNIDNGFGAALIAHLINQRHTERKGAR